MNIWSWKKCALVSLRFGLFVAAIITLFWYIWSFFAPVPIITIIQIAPETIYELPFVLSRWSDVFFAPVFVAMLTILYGRIDKKENFVLGLVFGLSVGLVFVLSVGLGAVLVIGLGAGLIVVLGEELVFGLVFGLGVGLGVGLVFGLGAGLVFGLGAGLVVGLGAGLVWIAQHLRPFFLYLCGKELQ